jgi:hypothetical protein
MIFRLILSSLLAFSVIAATAEPKALDLSGYQSEDGLIGTFKGGTVADPYFGLYVLALAQDAGLDVAKQRKAFINWGLAAQKPDGRFSRYCLQEAIWVACAKSDSDDATLARWIHLLYRDTPVSESLAPALRRSAELAEKALFGLELPSGVYSVFQHDTPGYAGYALFKDNVEVLSVFEQLAVISENRNEPSRARLFNEKAKKLRLAMSKEFVSFPEKTRLLAIGAKYKKEMFYPHAVAIPFAWLENHYPTPVMQEWDAWLKKYRGAWIQNATTDFPWGLVALSAHKSGLNVEAGCWLKRVRPLRAANSHWNVLEEVSVQILDAAKVAEPSSCPSQ